MTPPHDTCQAPMLIRLATWPRQMLLDPLNITQHATAQPHRLIKLPPCRHSSSHRVLLTSILITSSGRQAGATITPQPQHLAAALFQNGAHCASNSTDQSTLPTKCVCTPAAGGPLQPYYAAHNSSSSSRGRTSHLHMCIVTAQQKGPPTVNPVSPTAANRP
jgi:hypothetical protein